MGLFHIVDYGLSALHLQAKHDPDDDGGEHFGYPIRSWAAEVANRETRLGYWQWVLDKIEEEQEELDACNPYTL